MQALSYRFPEANNPSYLAFFVLFGFFLFVFFLRKTRLGQTWSLGGLRFFVSFIFFALISVWFFYYQGGTHRFYALEATPDAIRLFFSEPDETISIVRADIASLTFGLDSPTRSNKTWCYLQVTTTSGQRLVSQNLSGTDCKTYRQQLAQLLRL
jgi:hypothetical protein